MAGVDRWDPMPIAQVVALLADLCVPWWIAGGWAIDLFLGRQTRPHGDTDVLVRRDDQLVVQQHLVRQGLQLFTAQRGELTPWLPGHFHARPFDDIWCCWAADAPWVLQLMLLDTDGDRWVFKRDASISGALCHLGLCTADGVPYLRPEIQLLYKAKPQTLAKDQADFDLVVPALSHEAQAWLLACLERRLPASHAWVSSLRARLSTGA